MRTDKIRKYVLPNIPYLFIGWACLKMGTAYRLAAGANFEEKLLGLMQTIGVAFANFSPGLDPFDWLIGFVGAVAFRLLIYFKSKNAKKYRRDEEYGSSRWGGPKDIQPFVDPKFENNVILTGTELLTMNTRPKIPANVDDGKTGTDTDREDFQRLLADIYSGKINCVIVKDLSRLSRNYTDAGNLIENLFVRLNIRFISLAEGVDSYRNPDSVSNIIVPITNVMNDQYCYQTSKKIRQVFDMKRRNGEFIGSYAPYGYIKDPQDKHALLVDPEAAEIVKRIFSMSEIQRMTAQKQSTPSSNRSQG